MESHLTRSDEGGERAQRIEGPSEPILARMRFLSRLLDNSILLPGGYRIGIDPIIGLVPVVGDVVASGLSLWLIWDALRLGIKKRVIAKMIGNVVLESLLGAIPLLGDFIDAAWKANARNMRLVELNYSPALRKRSGKGIALFMLACAAALLGMAALSAYAVIRGIIALFK